MFRVIFYPKLYPDLLNIGLVLSFLFKTVEIVILLFTVLVNFEELYLQLIFQRSQNRQKLSYDNYIPGRRYDMYDANKLKCDYYEFFVGIMFKSFIFYS